MDLSDACEEFLNLVKSGHWQDEFDEVYAMQIFIMALEQDESPAVALAAAKQMNSGVIDAAMVE